MGCGGGRLRVEQRLLEPRMRVRMRMDLVLRVLLVRMRLRWHVVASLLVGVVWRVVWVRREGRLLREGKGLDGAGLLGLLDRHERRVRVE